jgi:hypothetical protein
MWLRRGPFALVPIFALHGIDDVEWGILETNGPISFVKKK